MSDESAEPEKSGLPEAINRDVSQLIHHLRCSNAPDEVLAEATKHIQQAMETPGPVIVDFMIKETENVFPWIPAGESVNEILEETLPGKASERSS